jgi:hypothetical protein
VDNWIHRSAKMKCATCMYFVPKLHEGAVEGDLIRIGRCRRNAPTSNGFPAVFPLDWCGEHKLDENKLEPVKPME